MTLYTQQSKNVWRTWALMTIFLVVIIILGYIFAYVYQSPAILYFAVVFSVGMNIFSYWYSDKITLSTSGAKPAMNPSCGPPKNASKRLRQKIDHVAGGHGDFCFFTRRPVPGQSVQKHTRRRRAHWLPRSV